MATGDVIVKGDAGIDVSRAVHRIATELETHSGDADQVNSGCRQSRPYLMLMPGGC